MDTETIVAVYDTPAHAERAAADLRQAGVSASAIDLHASNASTNPPTLEPVREPGFWSRLFGGAADHDVAVYDRSMASGSTVLTVKAPILEITTIMEILDRHHPIDIDERATGFGLRMGIRLPTPTRQTAAELATSAPLPSVYGGPLFASTPLQVDDTGIGHLADEAPAVSNRLINRGGTRIRHYVVETPGNENFAGDHETVPEQQPMTDLSPAARPKT